MGALPPLNPPRFIPPRPSLYPVQAVGAVVTRRGSKFGASLPFRSVGRAGVRVAPLRSPYGKDSKKRKYRVGMACKL